VAADDGLLGVALAPVGQLGAALGDLLDDDLLDHLLGDDLGALGLAGLDQLVGVLVILDDRGGERLESFEPSR
jgi:hypothetical protein